MNISVNWSTKVISIARSELTLVSGSLYELDVNDLRLALKDEEASENGIHWPNTHAHNTEITLSGVTYARFIEIINGYTILFEDNQYTVRCVGANHNLADIKVANQVSLIIGNSAGLVSVETSGGGPLTSEQNTMLIELYKIMGLQSGAPLLVSSSARSTNGISQTIQESGGTVTVTRT